MPDFDRIWDETFPPDTQPANQLGLDLRQLKTDIRERVTLSGNDAAKPTNPQALEVGLLYFATDTNFIYRWSGTNWVNVTGSFFPAIKMFSDLTIRNTGVAGDLNSVVIPGNTLQAGSIVDLEGNINLATGIVASLSVSNGVVSGGSISTTGFDTTHGVFRGSLLVPTANNIVFSVVFHPIFAAGTQVIAYNPPPLTPTAIDLTQNLTIKISTTGGGGTCHYLWARVKQ